MVLLHLMSQAGLLEYSAVMAAAGATLGFMLGAKSGHAVAGPRQQMQNREKSGEGGSDESSTDTHEWPERHQAEGSAPTSASTVTLVVRASPHHACALF